MVENLFSSLVNHQAPELKDVAALVNDNPDAKISSSDFKGKWILLFSYPLDFTFVCPTEIKQLIAKADEFAKMNVQPILLSTDSAFSHLAWQQEIGKCPYPWIADTNLQVSSAFGILKEDQGITFRASILIDPNGIVQFSHINNLPVGRSTEETIRVIAAFQEAAKGKLLPCDWKPGDKPLN